MDPRPTTFDMAPLLSHLDPGVDWTLPGPRTRLSVISGEFDIYLVDQSRTDNGPRIHLANLKVGEQMLGVDQAIVPVGYRLVMRTQPGTEIRELPIASVEPAELFSASPSSISWYSRAIGFVGSHEPVQITAGSTSLSAGEVGTSATGLLIESASAPVFVGAAGNRAVDPIAMPMLLLPDIPIRSAVDVTITAVQLIPGRTDLEVFMLAARNVRAHLLQWAAVEFEHRHAQAKERITARESRDRQMLDESVHVLSRVISQDVKPAGEVADGLTARAVADVCRRTAISLPQLPVDGNLAAIPLLRELRLPYREVRLNGRWWTADSGVLLATRITPEGPQAVSVYRRRGKYWIWDPATGSSRPVNEQVASQLAPTAVVIIRPLPETVSGLRGLFGFVRPVIRTQLWLILAVGLLSALLALATPIASATVFNEIVPADERGALVAVILFLFGAAVAAAAMQLVSAFVTLRLTAHIQLSLQPAIWSRILNLPVRFFVRFSNGDLVSRSLGIETIQQLLTSSTVKTGLSVVFSLVSLVLVFLYSFALGLVALVITLIVNGLLVWLSIRQVHYSRVSARIGGEIFEVLGQFLGHVGELRTTGAEGRAFAQWTSRFASQRTAAVRAQRISNISTTLLTTFPTLIILALVVVAGIGRSDPISAGSFIAVSTALGQFGASMLAANSGLLAVIAAIPQLERLRPILEEPTESAMSGSSRPILDGSVSVRHVGFGYCESASPVLDDVSFDIKAGEMFAIVGPSGAGKSTLLRLLLGFEEMQKGSISYSGISITAIEPRSLRQQISAVLQDIKPMVGTIRDNIASPSTPDSVVWQAADLAGMTEFIASLPMGIDTLVDAGGSTFSGGQLQRLLIARALARESRIIILDEATSALDNATQAKVMANLAALRATRIVVAHRLSTIRQADRIVFLSEGKISETGTFDELMSSSTQFRIEMNRQLISS